MCRLFVGILILAGVDVASAADNLRVATFNVNWGNIDLPDIARAIEAADADLICIQESTRLSERFLRRRFAADYRYIVFQGHRAQYAAERFGFLSRRPLTDVQYAPPVDGLFGTYFATVTHEDRPVRVVNVHLSPFRVRRGSTLFQAFQAITAVETIHEKEIKTVVTKVDSSHPTLVCGDFNSMSTFSAPRQLVTLGLTDSFASVTEDADSQPTWRWPVGRFHIQFRIDYIFHTNHFATVSSGIVATTGSDHYLVVTEVAWKRPSRAG